jgi:uncharacterized protein YndB with AHSA1/START domain
MRFYPDSFKVSTPTDCSIEVSRDFNAPRELVFDAFTKPEFVRRWLLGPDGWTMPICEIDLRVGGRWRFVGRGPTGDIPAFHGVYKAIEAPSRLVFTEIFEPFPDGESLVTQLLTPEGGRTRLTMTARYDSRATRDAVIRTGMEKGAATSYDRLEDLLHELRG